MSEQMRKEFEAWHLKRYGEKRFSNPALQLALKDDAWEIWQAALAAQPQAPQRAGTGLFFDRREIEYQKLHGGGEGVILVNTTKTVSYNTEILVAPETPEGAKP